MIGDEKYRECLCRQAGDHPFAELKKYANDIVGEATIFEHEVMFVCGGSFRILINGSMAEQVLSAGDFVFMPAGTSFSYRFLEDSELLFARMIESVRECGLYRINKKQYGTDKKPDGVYALKADKHMKIFTKGLATTVADGMTCINYLNAKGAEFIYLLHAYYSNEDCTKFFSSIANTDIKFSEFVRNHYHEYDSVQAMVDSQSTSLHNFVTQFKRVFGENPNVWRRKMMARSIYLDLCQSRKSIKEILMEHRFSDHANFSRYCRNTFKATAKQIRKGLDSDSDLIIENN